MKHKYVYKVIATCNTDVIVKKSDFNIDTHDEAIYSIVSDMLQEFYYYGAADDVELEATYNATFDINLEFNEYIITYEVLSNNPNILTKMFERYFNADIFEINSVFMINGEGEDEIYDDLCIEPIVTKNMNIQVKLFKLRKSHDYDYEYTIDTDSAKLMDEKNIKICL